MTELGANLVMFYIFLMVNKSTTSERASCQLHVLALTNDLREFETFTNMVILRSFIKSQERGAPHEQVIFICLKQAIYKKLVQLRQFGEIDVEHLYKQTLQRKVRKNEERKCSAGEHSTMKLKDCYTLKNSTLN